MSRRLALLVALAAAALDAGAVAIFWKVHEARRAFALQIGDDASLPTYTLRSNLDVEEQALQIGGGALLVLGLVAALAGLAWARRRSTGPVATIAVVAPPTVLGLAGAGILGLARANLPHYDGCGDPLAMEPYRYETFASHAVYVQAARLAILAVALLSTAAVLALVRRSRASGVELFPNPRVLASAVLFVAGLAAFAATRAEAGDTEKPMPRLLSSARLWLHPSLVATMPAALGCEPGAEDAPVLVLERGVWSVDGVSLLDAAELTRILTAKRDLWQMVMPNRRFPGVLAAAIPADTPRGVVRPMLAAARTAGFTIVDVIEGLAVAPWASRTLGDVSYVPRGCHVRLAAGQELPLVATWGEMARATVVEAAAPPESIAPLILPMGFPDREVTSTADPRWDKEPGAAVTLDETFLLEVGMGSGLHGLNVTTVPASGHCRHVYREWQKRTTASWRQVDFDVDPEELGRLVQRLTESDFLHLAQRYEARVDDGTQWVVHLRTGGRDKYVSASNAFPEPLIAVARFVGEQLVDTRPELRDRTRPAPLNAAYGDHLWRGARRYLGLPEERWAPGPLGELNGARVDALLVPGGPLPAGTHLETVIQDQTAGGRVLARRVEQGSLTVVPYAADRVDPRHHYALVVTLTRGRQVLATSEALPVITFDGPHALEVPLARP